jgi:hypothetical protein
MKLRFIWAAATIALAVLSLGVITGPGSASAAPRPAADPGPVLAIDDHDFNVPAWLRRSIIRCAAETTDLDVAQVVYALREGHSLKEIGIRAGVRPALLEQGILRCERINLARLVEAGELSPTEARRINLFLENHITRIINFHWNPSDEALGE